MSDLSGIHEKTVVHKAGVINQLLFWVVCVLLNLVPSWIATAADWSVWLDTIGTVVSAALGGYIPAILVGFITNLLKGFTDISSVYYTSISVLIAIAATFLSHRGFLEKIYKSFIFALILSVIGGGLGGLLPWILKDLPTEGFLADLGIDLIDKIITIAVALVLIRLVPASKKADLEFRIWKQRPLSAEDEKRVKSVRVRKTSLNIKSLLIFSISLIALVVGATIISFIFFRNSIIDEYKQIAENVSVSASKIIDPSKISEYMSEGDDSEEYRHIEEELKLIRDSAVGVEYLYVYIIEEDGCHVVFDLDTDDVEGSEPGDIMPFDDSFLPVLDDLLAGNEIAPMISNDSFGWLLTSYIPLKNADGECVAYIGSDISMDRLKNDEVSFVVQMFLVFSGLAMLIIAVALFLIRYNVVYPINAISLRMQELEFDDDDSLAENYEKMRQLDIWTGDEVEKLYYRILRMMQKDIEYMEEISNKTQTIAKMQNSLIIVLADMVESRDKNTGQHIKKTAAYVGIILRKMQEMGMHPEEIDDDFINNVVNSAPLHDIGKIQVPDAILNKPGKLDDEEYDIMKEHTVAGEDVIERVIKEVPESGYLNVAKDLAHYHHEKWNGQGYPEGIAGTDIPLSARVMAVADVFDALVSRRVYKPGMPMDKAVSIIKNDAGSHFDPEVVEAFCAAEDEIREVKERFEALEDVE